MSPDRSTARAALMALCLIAAGCGGSSSSPSPTSPTTPTPPAPPPPVTTTVAYSGLFASGLFTGSVTMTAQVPVGAISADSNAPLAIATATGTAKFAGASTTTVNLTGTYDTTTGKFTLTSPGWTVDATVGANGVVSGTVSTPAGAGTVAALVTTEASPVVNYCGTYTGSEAGKFLVTIRGGLVTGVAAQNGQPGGIVLGGTANGNSVTISWSWVDDGVGNGTASGTINGTTLSGTWQNSLGHSGTWSGGAGC